MWAACARHMCMLAAPDPDRVNTVLFCLYAPVQTTGWHGAAAFNAVVTIRSHALVVPREARAGYGPRLLSMPPS